MLGDLIAVFQGLVMFVTISLTPPKWYPIRINTCHLPTNRFDNRKTIRLIVRLRLSHLLLPHKRVRITRSQRFFNRISFYPWAVAVRRNQTNEKSHTISEKSRWTFPHCNQRHYPTCIIGLMACYVTCPVVTKGKSRPISYLGRLFSWCDTRSGKSRSKVRACEQQKNAIFSEKSNYFFTVESL